MGKISLVPFFIFISPLIDPWVYNLALQTTEIKRVNPVNAKRREAQGRSPCWNNVI